MTNFGAIKQQLDQMGLEDFLISFRSNPVIDDNFVQNMKAFLLSEEGSDFRSALVQHLEKSEWNEFECPRLRVLIVDVLNEPGLLNHSGNNLLSVFINRNIEKPSQTIPQRQDIARQALSILNALSPENLGQPNSIRQTTLHIAIQSGFSDVAGSIIDKMAATDLGRRDREGCAPLHLAIKHGKSQIVTGATPMQVQAYVRLTQKIIAKTLPEHLALQTELSREMPLHLIIDRTGLARGNVVREHFTVLSAFWPALEDLLARMRPEDILKKNETGLSALAIAESIQNNSTEAAIRAQYFGESANGSQKTIDDVVGLLKSRVPALGALFGFGGPVQG